MKANVSIFALNYISYGKWAVFSMHHVAVQAASYTSQTNAVSQALIQKGRWWSDKTDQIDTEHTNPGWPKPATVYLPWMGRGTNNEGIPINPKETSASDFSTLGPTDLPKA